MFSKKHLYALLAAALMAAPVAALADPVYSVKFLPDGFEARALGNNGLVAGFARTDTGVAAATYANGSLTRYDNLGILSINGVSSNGMFTGGMLTPGMTEEHAFILRDGAIQDIGSFGGQHTMGSAINAAGQVAAEAFNGPYDQALVYSNGAMRDLGLGIGHNEGVAINEAGVIVGGATDMNVPDYHAFMYCNGVVTDLGAPDRGGSFATGINNSGDIVGSFWEYGGPVGRHAFLYTGGVMHDLGTFGGIESDALAINDSGLVVGFFGSDASRRAYLYNNGTAWDLNTLVSGAAGWTITSASAINAAGQILASACNIEAVCRDVMLDPVSAVPEPATYAMLLAGVAVLAGRRRANRRRAGAAA
jgi:probable HAF family extracellular repeat protein